MAVVDQRDRAHAVAHLDAVLLGELEVLVDQARAAALGLDREAAPELELAVDHVGLPAPDRVELHALAVQPAHRVARAADQAVAQLAVGAVLRDAEHVVVELVGGVGAEVAALDLVRGEVRHDRLEVVDAVIDAAERAGGEARVAAHQLLGRALDHQHPGALARRQRRAERRIAGADHHHVPTLIRHVSPPDSSSCRHAGVRITPSNLRRDSGFLQRSDDKAIGRDKPGRDEVRFSSDSRSGQSRGEPGTKGTGRWSDYADFSRRRSSRWRRGPPQPRTRCGLRSARPTTGTRASPTSGCAPASSRSTASRSSCSTPRAAARPCRR